MDESEVREAVDYYTKEGNKELKKITDDIRTMFIGFGGTRTHTHTTLYSFHFKLFLCCVDIDVLLGIISCYTSLYDIDLNF